MTVILVQPLYVDAIWHQLTEGFASAIKKSGGDISLGYLWQEARAGRAFLMVAHEGERVIGASVWRPETWEDGAALRCVAMFGAEAHFEELQAEGLALAKRCGADRIVFEGRKGWARSKLFERFKVRELRILYEIRE